MSMIWFPKDIPLRYVPMSTRLDNFCKRHKLETVGEMEDFFLNYRRGGKTRAARNAYPPGCGPVMYKEYSGITGWLMFDASMGDKVDRLSQIVHYLCDRVADPAPPSTAMKEPQP